MSRLFHAALRTVSSTLVVWGRARTAADTANNTKPVSPSTTMYYSSKSRKDSRNNDKDWGGGGRGFSLHYALIISQFRSTPCQPHARHTCMLRTSQTEPLPIVGFICPLAPCPFTPIVWFLPRVQHQQAGSGDLKGSHIISRLGEGREHNYHKYITNHESRVVPRWKMHTPWQLLEIKTCFHNDKNYRWLFWYTIVRLHPVHKQHYMYIGTLMTSIM